jgi:threonine synthase
MPSTPLSFRCPAARGGDDVDHLLTPRLELAEAPPSEDTEISVGVSNPFLQFRRRRYSHAYALSRGLSDESYCALVRTLDQAVAQIAGTGFRCTPLTRADGLAHELELAPGCTIWIKDETNNVAESHKARHMFGLMLYLRLAETIAAGLLTGRRLAVASCGNAALAAAVVAKAATMPIDIFIPENAGSSVVARLELLGAALHRCPRHVRETGDPCVHRFRDALEQGAAIPFSCQGNENGLVIEGGMTLGEELVAQLRQTASSLDRILLQVGGGALASATIQALIREVQHGRLPRCPKVHAVQTQGAAPLRRAYRNLALRILARLTPATNYTTHTDPELAAAISARLDYSVVEQELGYAATHRSQFMWAWETEPASLAHGILDDETYDWHQIVRGMLISGGYPLVVDEATLVRANELARRTTSVSSADHTGSSGLAGLVVLSDRGELGQAESIGLVFSGKQR